MMFVRRSVKNKITKRSRKKILKAVQRIGIVLAMLAVILGYGKIQGTNSFFMDTSGVNGNSITAGYWIPTLTMTVDPASPDGQNGFYKTTPCVTLEAKLGDDVASLSDVDIYFEFSDDGDPVDGGTLYSGTCVDIPDGNPTHFQAIAVNKANPDWKSDVVSRDFKVDTKCPVAELTDPHGGDELSGDVDIRGKVTDESPDHYWLVIEDSEGHQIAGPGTVNDTHNFDGKFFTWDTTGVPDGDYTIKLEARDQAGNKCPDEAPVTEDPNEPCDSVDWIQVKVNNNGAEPGDVVINEVMWMGSLGDSDDEWVELRNTTSHDINISGWIIENAHASHGSLTIPDGSTIKAKDYFLISHKNKSDSKIDVDPDVVDGNISFNNNYKKNGQLVLKNKALTEIDSTPPATKSDWPKGENGLIIPNGLAHWSMERNDKPSSGWHTCVPVPPAMKLTEIKLMLSYWDKDSTILNCGTPAHSNLSENDSSLEEEAIQKESIDQNAGAQNSSQDGAGTNIITKEFSITTNGKLDVPDGYEADVSQKMKKIELSGEDSAINGLQDFEIDLAKINVKKEEGKIEFKVSDLGLPNGVELASGKAEDVILVITVGKKDDSSSDGKDGKKDGGGDKIKPSDEAALPSNGDNNKDAKKDDGKKSGDGSGDGGSGSGGDSGNSDNPAS